MRPNPARKMRIMPFSHDPHLSWEEISIVAYERGFEQGFEQGFKQGLRQSLQQGSLGVLRRSLLHLLHQRFVETPKEIVEKIEACKDLEVLEIALGRVLEISSPEELEF